MPPLKYRCLRIVAYMTPQRGKCTQALAKESMVNFINVKPSMLQSKWFGDTQKLVQATFSLAAKLQPCIIFVGKFLLLISALAALNGLVAMPLYCWNKEPAFPYAAGSVTQQPAFDCSQEHLMSSSFHMGLHINSQLAKPGNCLEAREMLKQDTGFY